MSIIVDAAPVVASAMTRDPRRAQVQAFLTSEGEELIMPAPVTAEVDYLLRRRGGQDAARGFIQALAGGVFRVESLTIEEHGLALALHDRYADMNLGLADISVMVLAYRFRTRRILTFDQRDFRPVQPIQGGHFLLLPSDKG